MRLTIGSQPAAVYWRRRAVVLVGLAIVVLVVFYACNASLSSGAGPVANTIPSGEHTPTSAGPTFTLQHPTSPTVGVTTSATASAGSTFTLATEDPGSSVTTSGACTDAEMSVDVRAGSAVANRGSALTFTISIKNSSARTCARDVGADVQEIRLLDDADAIVWSSDDCSPNHGHDVRSFAPGQDASFTLTWLGARSRTGTGAKICGTTAKAPDVGAYRLIGRLDQKLSAPFALQLRAA